MTIEEKAKAWDEAIERAKSKIRNDKDHVLYEDDILDIFPSLKESDEERIRKEIVNFINHKKAMGSVTPEESKRTGSWIAWVEKQGEQKPIEEVKPKFKVGDWVICKNGSHRVFQVIKRSWPNAEYLDEKGAGGFLNVATLDKQYRPWTIQDAKAGDLLADDYGIYIFDRFDEWDEKCFYCMGAYQRSQKVYENEQLLCSIEVHPATKEQRDLLFQKMKEAGYEWDADKKESKMIEQKFDTDFSDLRTWKYIVDAVWTEKEGIGQYLDSPFTEEVAKKLQIRFGNIEQILANSAKTCKGEQKLAWSEKYIADVFEKVGLAKIVREQSNDNLTNALQDAMIKLSKFTPLPKQEWREEDETKLNDAIDACKAQYGNMSYTADWLLSLKERYTWKPSDEQMDRLKGTINSLPHQEVLYSLYQDLKKLKEE